jgi:hypothetical protein
VIRNALHCKKIWDKNRMEKVGKRKRLHTQICGKTKNESFHTSRGKMKKSTTFKGQPKPFGKSGHFHEPRRHSLQARGIKTGRLAWEKIGDVAKPKFQSMYGLKGKQDVVWLDNWDRGNWAIVRGKEIAPSTYKEEEVLLNVGNKKEAKSFLKDYMKNPDADDDGVPNEKDCEPLDPTKQGKSHKKGVQDVLQNVMNKERQFSKKVLGEKLHEKFKKDYGDDFADVKVYTDKVMKYEYNDDPSRGWTGTMSYMDKKPKDSNVVMVVTYDGAGYDYFSINEGGKLTQKFQEALDKKFGKGRYHIEHNNNWSFSVIFSHLCSKRNEKCEDGSE